MHGYRNIETANQPTERDGHAATAASQELLNEVLTSLKAPLGKSAVVHVSDHAPAVSAELNPFWKKDEKDPEWKLTPLNDVTLREIIRGVNDRK